MAPSRPAGPNHAVLFEKWMDTTRWLFERTRRMPVAVRHSLTARLEGLALAIIEDIVTATYRKAPGRVLTSANERLSRLRVVARLAHELGVLSHAYYEEFAGRMSEAGRLLGGWLRAMGPADAERAP